MTVIVLSGGFALAILAGHFIPYVNEVFEENKYLQIKKEEQH